jgi:hypothetical protein
MDGMARMDWGGWGSATHGKDWEGERRGRWVWNVRIMGNYVLTIWAFHGICEFGQISTMFFYVSYSGYFLCSVDLNTV